MKCKADGIHPQDNHQHLSCRSASLGVHRKQELAGKMAEICHQGPLEHLLFLRAQPVPCVRLFESNASPVKTKDIGALRMVADPRASCLSC